MLSESNFCKYEMTAAAEHDESQRSQHQRNALIAAEAKPKLRVSRMNS